MSPQKKLIIRLIVYSFIVLCIFAVSALYYFGDINKLKKSIEKNLTRELNCTVKLGNLEWDWDGLKLGVSTSEITLFDKENNLILQGGSSRAVWHLKDLIKGTYSHFYSIESSNLYLNAIRNEKGIWNLVAIFPPGPPPKVDNLSLNNSIIYIVDELNPTSKTVLYKDLNIRWHKKIFSKTRSVNLTTRVGSLTSPSFMRVKGKYTERKDFSWEKSQINLFINAKRINLANLHGYFKNIFKEPEIKKIMGEFTGKFKIEKKKSERVIKIKSKTKTNDFIVELKNKDTTQLIEIPKTDLSVEALIDKKKITINSFKSNIEDLTYELSGHILNWSSTLPEADLILKTNRFNFKAVKPYLPLSILPAETRVRIEPINDEGWVELDLKLNGPVIAPKYYGTILLSDFHLTAESGFLTEIDGLEGKLILDNEILNIDHLNIPLDSSPLIIKGAINNKNFKSSFSLNGSNLSIKVLQSLITQAGIQSPLLSDNISTEGYLDLNLDVIVENTKPPEIKGEINFKQAGLTALAEEPLEIKNVNGNFSLDGSKVIFSRLNGLINNEDFYINGDFSLKEDEVVNLFLYAEHLKVIRYILSFISSKTPFKPIADSVSGEFSDLNLNINGTLSKPLLDGMLLINNVSFNLPNLQDKIHEISGSLRFGGTELVIEQLNGMVQNSNFSVVGYIQDLFSAPKPKIRLTTDDVNIKPFWLYLKDQLKTTSLNAQAQALEKLEGIASLDIFLHQDIATGNVYFKDGQIKYKSLPFGLNNLEGRLVIGDKNLSLFGLMGLISEGNDFNCDLTVFNYLEPSFKIQGKLSLNTDAPALIKAVNPNFPNQIITDGLIPSLIDFDISFPWANISFYSTLNEMLQLEFQPFIRKPVNKSYEISGNIDLNTDEMKLYVNQFNIMSNKLSISTTGSIKNLISQNPELMLYFNTDGPSTTFMIIEPVIPLMGLKLWGTIDLNGSLTGTPSSYQVSANANITNIRMPHFLGKKLTAKDGTFSIYLDKEQGFLTSMIGKVKYASLKADNVSLSAKYENPVIYLNELFIDAEPGNIFAAGLHNPKDGSAIFNASGTDFELSSLGSFIFLDPDKISGKTNFAIALEGKGKTKEEFISNTNGNISFSVIDGKLGQVALLQKGIQAANLFKQGIFGFNISNIFSLFFKYQDGGFKTIDGKIDISKGIVKAKEFHYRAKNLFLNSFGFIDLNNSFIGLKFYGYLPEQKDNVEPKKDVTLKDTVTNTVSGALTIVPELLNKGRVIIPFLHLTPPRYFKFEVKGELKNQKKVMRRTAHSFKWLRGKRLEKEFEFVPKGENN